jgi:adenylyltransferase/sulfurtransferase
MSFITGDQLVAKLRKEIKEIDVHQLAEELKNNKDLVLIDVREHDEWIQGRIEGSLHLSRGFLELQVENFVADRGCPIAVTCAGGVRSLMAVRSLEEMGYTNVVSVAGGFSGWKNAGYPFSRPRRLTDDQRERYSRHTIMPEVGEVGQLKLLDGKVLLIPGRHLPGGGRGRDHRHRRFRRGRYQQFAAANHPSPGRCRSTQGRIGQPGDCPTQS